VRRGRWSARLKRGCCVLLCGLAISVPPLAAQSGTAQAAAHANRAGPRMAIDSLSPKAAKPKSVLRVSGRLMNSTGHALNGVRIRLRYSSTALVSRGQLRSYANGSFSEPQGIATQQTLHDNVAAKSSVRWSLKVPVSRLGLSEQLGVYPIEVDAVNAAGQSLGKQRTFLTFAGAYPNYQRTHVAWLWPIIDRPHRADDYTFVDNELGRAVTHRGRLGRLVDAAAKYRKHVPLTWIVDPSVVDDANAMAGEHRLTSHGRVVQAGADPDAQTWLEDLSSATADSRIVATPYADPDDVALTRAGLDGDLKPSLRDGAQLAGKLLNRKFDTDLAWPPLGLANTDTLDVLALAGAKTIVLSTKALPPASRLTYTPSEVTTRPTSDGTVRVLLADDTLTSVFSGTRQRSSPLITEQRFLAETALITAEQPNVSRTIVAAPPHRWNPADGLADSLLRDTASMPWLKPVATENLQPTTGVERHLSYPPGAQRSQLGSRYLDEVAQIREHADRFGGLLPTATRPFGFAIARTESSAWRNEATQARRVRSRVRSSVNQTINKVRFVNNASVTLSGSQAKIPVTITNDLDDGDGGAEARAANTVTIRVNVRAPNSNSLSIGHYTTTRRIAPKSKTTVYVPVTARAIGVNNLELTLFSPKGEPVADPVSMKIRVTNIGETASWITGGALGVAVIATAVQMLRRRRRAARSAGETEADTMEAGTGEPGASTRAERVASGPDATRDSAEHAATEPGAQAPAPDVPEADAPDDGEPGTGASDDESDGGSAGGGPPDGQSPTSPHTEARG